MLLSVLSNIAPLSNILVVDDGSCDGTDIVCAELSIACIVHPVNLGKGASLSDGFNYLMDRTNFKWVITLDADGQHAVEDIAAFLDFAVQNPLAGLCIGARSMKRSTMPLARIVSNALTSRILSVLAGQNIPDSQCGFRIYSAALLKKAPCRYPRFEMESEIILKAAHYNFPIGHSKVQTLYFNGPSHIAHVRDTLRWVKSVMIIWWKLRKSD
jgi:glycosyltransferase involved in cell wall biosynthesis